MAFSIDEKEFSCVSSKYILIYSFDKLCEKMAKDIYADDKNEGSKRIISNKDVIYTGRDSNLVYCSYHTKGVLVVASSTIKKY